MDIIKDFYKSEVIDGYYVPAIMKRLWAASLEILNDISELCERHHIRWWLDFGNMLGAVRHGGFIPWDDDIDISMHRDDFQKFYEFAQKELSENYKISSIYTDEAAAYFTVGVCNGAGKDSYDSFLKKYHGFPCQAVVDIFIYDDIDMDHVVEEAKFNPIRLLISVINTTEKQSLINDCPEHIVMMIEEIEKLYQCSFDREKPINRQLMLLCDGLMKPETKAIKAEEMACKAYIRGDDYEMRVLKSNYSFFVNASGFLKYPVPIIMEDSLVRQYGDYMRPVKGGSNHDYPHYEKYISDLHKKAGFLLWDSYAFREEDARGEKLFTDISLGHKEIVFLISKSSNWKFMEREYGKYIGKDEFDVYVIPIPYYDKNYRNEFDGLYFETEGFPADVSITKPDEYDFYGKHPDIVYYDDPYDNYDAFTSVHPMFYSDKIRQFAKKMVYVSCILVDEYEKDDTCPVKMMKHCILTPGVARADEVIVQSENMRQRYIEALIEWAGEDTRNIWEERIKGTGINRDDIKEYPEICRDDLSEDWINALYKPDGNRKEVILYHAGISNLAKYGDIYIEKMKELFKEYGNDRDRILYFNPDPRINESLKDYDEELWNSYLEVIDCFIEEDRGIYDDGEDDYFMVCLCDRFIGDMGKAMYHCIRAGKPVERISYEN